MAHEDDRGREGQIVASHPTGLWTRTPERGSVQAVPQHPVPSDHARGNMPTAKKSSLRRERYPMPRAIRAELDARGLMAAYEARPAYQQNDYLGWIGRAKLEPTRRKRIDQMLAGTRRWHDLHEDGVAWWEQHGIGWRS